jgi:hypothetical protein
LLSFENVRNFQYVIKIFKPKLKKKSETNPQYIRLPPAELNAYKLCSNEWRSFVGNEIDEGGGAEVLHFR